MRKVKKKIVDLLESMEKVFILSIKKVENINELDNELIDLINMIIDGFVTIENSIADNADIKLESYNYKFADLIVELIELINNGNIEKIKDFFEKEFKREFYIWKNGVKKSIKFKIAIYGLNDNLKLLSFVLDFNKVEIIAYIDNNDKNTEKSLSNNKIIKIKDIDKYNYDYLILLSEKDDLINEKIDNNIIDKEKIFYFSRYCNTNFDYNFYRKYYTFLESDKNFEGIITGLSYLEVGIDTKYLNRKFYNFAVSSQDLFYDYKIMEYILSNKEIANNMKYAIIGLSYYSFEYDMSKGNGRLRTNIYYPIFNTMHNYNNSKQDKEIYNKFIDNSRYILCDDFQYKMYNQIKDATEIYLNKIYSMKFNTKKLTPSELEEKAAEIKKDFKKNYPNTVIENKEIFKSYLELLKINNIKPIVIVCPQTIFYQKYSSERIRAEFLGIINEFKKMYEFQFINYFESDKFEDSDFYDTSHLNYKGSKKFTEMLNKDINW